MTEPRYRRHPSVELRDDGDVAVALHVGTGQYFELNGSARYVWERLDASPTVDALVADVVAAFSIAEDEARDAITELLQALLADGLVILEGERRRDRLWRRVFGR